MVGADGTNVRTRQVDGLHLCAAGAERLGRVLLDALVADFHAHVKAGWEAGAWQREAVYPPASCPSP